MIKEGKKIVYIFFVISVVIWLLSSLVKFLLPITIIFCLITLLLINFFRDPNRIVKKNDSVLYSPADGKIFDIVETENTYCVKIFMSIFNVHIQRSPTDAVVKKIEYKQEEFIPAGKKYSDIKNEQNIVVLQDQDQNEFIITQIAGILARRIVCWVKEGQKIQQGQKIGAILLGSQVNFIFPKDKFRLLVSKNQKVFAGITTVAVRVKK
jgi:phosphatidylserine decarboxylase